MRRAGLRRPVLVGACGLAAMAAVVGAPAGPVTASPRTPVSAVADPAARGAAFAGATASNPAVRGTVPAPASGRAAAKTLCGPPYVNDDRRLGPRRLPRAGLLGRILRGYERFGGISPARFLRRYWDRSAEPPGWRYPPDDGFARAGGYINGRPLRSRVTLAIGARLDRFGGEYGSYLARAGTPYAGRALPPDSLNTRADDPGHVCNYHLYRVARAFRVAAGPAVPAFQQPGMKRQYHLVGSYVPEAPAALNVRWLVDHGYLRRVR